MGHGRHPGRSRVTRRILAGLVAATAAAAGAAVAPAPMAHAVGMSGAAYVLLNTPALKACAVPDAHNWNSVHHGSANQVCPDGVGRYSVLMPGLAASGGTALVTAYGSDNTYCKLLSFGPTDGRQRVRVVCFDRAGNLANSRFAVSYTKVTNAAPGNHIGYLLANRPTVASYAPPADDQYNSQGGTNTVERSRPGEYLVTMPDLAGPGVWPAAVQITAVGKSSRWCTEFAFGASDTGPAARMYVRCFNTAGQLADSAFTVTYLRPGNVLGQQVYNGTIGHPTAFMWALDPTRDAYTPGPAFRYTRGYAGGVTRLGVGRYEVDYGETPATGVVHVTAGENTEGEWSDLGTPALCKVESWPTDHTARVKCTAGDGTPVDTRFHLHHVGPLVGGL